MDEYPELRFAYSQPASYEAVGKRSPALFENVRARIRSGQWKATSASLGGTGTILFLLQPVPRLAAHQKRSS